MSKPIYAPIPARAIGDQKLSALDLRVLAALAAHDRLGANGIGCYASHPRLAALVGCHEKSLSRSLATLAGNGGGQKYIEPGRHPLNARLRVYRVVYTEFDKAYLAAAIGNDAATNRKRRKGNEPVTEDPAIGNQIAPQEVTEPNEVSDKNQSLSSVNIFSETGIHPVETGNTFSEAASSDAENDRNDIAVAPSQGLLKKEPSAAVGAMLAMCERGLKGGLAGERLRWWFDYLERQVGDRGELEYGTAEYGRAFRLYEDIGAKLDEAA